MAKTIRELLNINEEKEKKYKAFFLDDRLNGDPRKFCPDCESDKLRSLHTHNVDGYDFKCLSCNLQYTVWLCNKGEAF